MLPGVAGLVGNGLIDTNILIYAHVQQDVVKRERALDFVRRLIAAQQGAVSSQVLAEFFYSVTAKRKFAAPLSFDEAYSHMQDMMEAWDVIDITPAIIVEAIRGVREHGMNYWDAQIWATARLNQISVIYSEDGPTGANIEGVRYINPLLGPPLTLVKESAARPYGRPRRTS